MTDKRTNEQLHREVLDRMTYFYAQTNGTMRWPNSAEGDLLQLVYELLSRPGVIKKDAS